MEEMLFRLLAAVTIGGTLGLNRYVHHNYIGLRTLSIVALSGAALILGVQPVFSDDGVSRVIQGLLTGVGFIGAGVIVRGQDSGQVQGLTSAAAVLLSLIIGILCALAEWKLVAAVTVLSLFVLTAGGPIERFLVARLRLRDRGRKAAEERAEKGE